MRLSSLTIFGALVLLGVAARAADLRDAACDNDEQCVSVLTACMRWAPANWRHAEDVKNGEKCSFSSPPLPPGPQPAALCVQGRCLDEQFPVEWTACSARKDCVIAARDCSYWVPLDKKHLREAGLDPQPACKKSDLYYPRPHADCRNKVCVIARAHPRAKRLKPRETSE